ncbi:MAG: hypothetical protein Q9220_000089 [cf. Caloplaca sp. 1 TL-2023]
MSQPSTRGDVFQDIHERALRLYLGMLEYGDFVKAEVAAANTRYPFMQNATKDDFYDYFYESQLRDLAAARAGITNEDDVFHDIKDHAIRARAHTDRKAYQDFVKAGVAAARTKYSFMRDATADDYYDFHLDVRRQNNAAAKAEARPPITDKDGVFYNIDQMAPQRQRGGQKKSEDFVGAELAIARTKYPFMQDITPHDFYDYLTDDVRRNAAAEQAKPLPISASDFWQAAYDFDPLGDSEASMLLTQYMMSGRAGPYTIGKLYGHTTLKLIPSVGSLLPEDMDDFEPPDDYDYAQCGCVAISYPDGHPAQETAITASEDDKLRRFMALGWVMGERYGRWEKTGHVLVMDMDDRSVRHRAPWMVLATEWPTDGEETASGYFTIYSEKEVARDDRFEPGVFPGDNNRTPICQIRPMDLNPQVQDAITLNQLGEDFNFMPVRLGGHRRATIDPENGPALAWIMEWYHDPEKNEEVCYTKDGLEYMRYNPVNKSYTFPDFDKMSFKGEHGFFGTLEERAELEVIVSPPVPLTQRLAHDNIRLPPGDRQRDISVTEGS